MIKGYELRIGNKFSCMGMEQTVFEILDNTDRGKIIQKGYEHLILVKENGNQYKPIEMQPISLTKEHLVRSGFTSIDKWNTAFDKAITISGEMATFRIMIVDNGYWIIIDKPTGDGTRKGMNLGTYRYIHELQNIYLDIAREELIIKE